MPDHNDTIKLSFVYNTKEGDFAESFCSGSYNNYRILSRNLLKGGGEI